MKVSLKVLAALTIVAVASACAPQGGIDAGMIGEDEQDAPNTELDMFESQTGFMPAEKIKPGAHAFISAEQVRLRSTPAEGDNIAGYVSVNDEIEIIDNKELGAQRYVAIRVVKSKNSKAPIGANVYISVKYLNEAPIKLDPSATGMVVPAGSKTPALTGGRVAQSNRLFVVTNIATEKLRVYERCSAGQNCTNRMIFETDVVSGQNEAGNRTNVGSFRISQWTKFYEVPGKYPAWFKPGYPDVPGPGDRRGWFSSDYMPGGKGDMRGAFGWYTAFVGPNPQGQWTHGTAGWGKDKKDFVLFKNSFLGFLAQLFNAHIRSHGCTRVDNESIAYLRSLVPIGTPLIKIYADEGLRDGNRTGYTKNSVRWNYILTKRGHQQSGSSHQLADRELVLKQGTPQSEWLDQGTYEVDQYPDPADGDIYRVGTHGTFNVDDGTVSNYQHPSGLGRGGFADHVVPDYMISRR